MPVLANPAFRSIFVLEVVVREEQHRAGLENMADRNSTLAVRRMEVAGSIVYLCCRLLSIGGFNMGRCEVEDSAKAFGPKIKAATSSRHLN